MPRDTASLVKVTNKPALVEAPSTNFSLMILQKHELRVIELPNILDMCVISISRLNLSLNNISLLWFHKSEGTSVRDFRKMDTVRE
jgi:hypothetical protein